LSLSEQYSNIQLFSRRMLFLFDTEHYA